MLLIITDGVITDMPQTVAAIIAVWSRDASADLVALPVSFPQAISKCFDFYELRYSLVNISSNFKVSHLAVIMAIPDHAGSQQLRPGPFYALDIFIGNSAQNARDILCTSFFFLLLQASTLPMSIIIVGVGEADFTGESLCSVTTQVHILSTSQ